MSEVQKLDFKDSKYATGRRKTSIAKVWLKKGSGQIVINGKKYENYFTSRNTTPSTVYIQRCVMFKGNPPGEDWDGVWTMVAK